MDYPSDDDGNVLRHLASQGNDMSRPMLIDFPVVVSTEPFAKDFAEIASKLGYRTEIWKHDDGPNWDVICSVEMVPNYADIVRIQRELTNWAGPFGGYCNCWGTFGNRKVS